MGKTKKVVENYQIVETLEEYQDDYEILLAKHVTEKEYYVMKKLGTKETRSKALYDGLLNQAAILKLLHHDNIVKCFRMLKTSNNIYLIYTYREGPTLQELLDQGSRCLTFTQKEAIAKQLCLILTEMQKRGISHLNIIPENIVVSGDDSILLREFIYAMEIPEEGQIAIKRKVPKSEYIAPEVRKGVACFEADIFSFGRILQRLEFRKCKKESSVGTDLEKKIAVFENLIGAMLQKNRQERVGLSQVYQALFSKVRKAKRMKSLNESNMYTSKMSSRSMSASKSQFGSKKAYADIVLKILRQRNMSWLLIKLFARVVEIKLGTQLTTVLSFLLLKKSTKSLANLSKYLHYGRNDINIDITPKEQAKFFKTSDYFKLCELIDKEVQLQKKEFDTAVETIYINNSSLVKRPQINREVKEQTVSDDYLSLVISLYLKELLECKDILQKLERETLADFYLLSQMLVFGKVEDMFRARIMLEPVNLDEQIFIRKMKEMQPELLIENIRLNCEAKRS